MRLDSAAVRRIVLAAQGLDRTKAEPIRELVARTGFIRTLGGVDAYVALLARHPKLEAKAVHDAVAKGDVRVSPSVRGCMYLVADTHVATCLAISAQLSRTRDDRDAEKAGIKKGEVEKLGKLVLASLQNDGPATTDAVRKRLPAGSVRSLGDAGKKVGVSSPLPQALRRLEHAGSIDRVPENDRLDSERYQWRVRDGEPIATPKDLHEQLAKLFFGWSGVATHKELAAWSGLGVRDATKACEAIDLQEVEVDGEPALATARALDVGDTDTVALTPFEDNVLALSGGPRRWIDPKHHSLVVPIWGSSKQQTIGEAKHMQMRSVIADGRIVGFWEFDPDANAVVTGFFAKPKGPVAAKIAAESDRLTTLLRDGLGHGRSFSLDTDDELRTRLAWLKKL